MSRIGEARYGLELAALLASPELRSTRTRPDAGPVLLIPGFMAGDASLAVLRAWLRRSGHRVAMSGMLFNVGCAERLTGRLQAQIRSLAHAGGGPVTLIGQSRGGSLARVLARREPECVSDLVMLGSPVLDPLAVSPAVLNAVRSVAWLGDAGVPGLFSTSCGVGECCATFREDLAASLPPQVRAVSIYSRSDGVVDWRACLDPGAECIEVESSHCGMSVNAHVFAVLDQVLSSGAPSENLRAAA